MSGSMDLIRPAELPAGQHQVVAVLEQLLEEARAGRIPGIAVIMPRGGRIDTIMAGAASGPDLHFGAALVQQKVMQVAAPPGGRPSALISPGVAAR